MRIIRFILDLPWWVGLPIFLIGNLFIPFGLLGYMIGFSMCLFGCWVFSKLFKPESFIDSFQTVVSIPLMALCLWFFNNDSIYWFENCDFNSLYVWRTVGGLLLGFNAVKGFGK